MHPVFNNGWDAYQKSADRADRWGRHDYFQQDSASGPNSALLVTHCELFGKSDAARRSATQAGRETFPKRVWLRQPAVHRRDGVRGGFLGVRTN